MMRNKPLILALAAALTSACTAAPLASPTEVNRAIIEDFARIFYSERDVRQAFEKHVAPDYIQHNPGIADGREAAIRALTPMFSRPEARFEVKRILVDGDLAAIHLLGRGDPATPGAALWPGIWRKALSRTNQKALVCSPRSLSGHTDPSNSTLASDRSTGAPSMCTESISTIENGSDLYHGRRMARRSPSGVALSPSSPMIRSTGSIALSSLN